MGVHGLWKKVRQSLNVTQSDFSENVRRGSTLLVDGNGFLFHLLNKQAMTMYQNMNPRFEREYGGNYLELHQMIDLELERLSTTLGFELIFYFDGDTRFFKGDTTKRRREMIKKNWSCWYDVVLGDIATKNIDYADLPLPPLAKDELMFVLHERKIRIVHCEHEADQELALECVRRNQSIASSRINIRLLKRTFVYSADSDFLLMKDCLLIAMGDLDAFTQDALPESTNVKVFREIDVAVWRRSAVASLLGMSENELLMKCITELGNDFTLHLLGGIGDNAHEFQLATDYSIAFYELQPLDEFHLMEEYCTHSNLDSLADLDNGVILLAEHRHAARSWVIFNSGRLINEKSFSAKIVSMFFKDWQQKSFPAAQTDNDSFSILRPYHFDVLAEMHNSIKEEREILKMRTRVPMQWENVCAANLYQLFSRSLRKNFERVHDDCPIWQPSNFFHAKLFHHLLFKRGTSLKQEISAPSQTPIVERKSESQVPILPVDAHKDTILQVVRQDTVTVIHGETGCGKSSKIPLFLLEDADKRKERCKIMIAQPRRIAVVNLHNRLKEFIGNKVGMRMGHGVREESKETQVFFVTTGYLVQLLAHSPVALRSITHLIVDEVHERSVDGDLLCWLTRRYLASNPSLKVLLMSATLHTQLYQDYFTITGRTLSVPQCLSVGVRRFPVKVVHVDDILQEEEFSHRVKDLSDKLSSECARMVKLNAVPPALVKCQYNLAVELVRLKGQLGKGVLIFVSGIADIIELQSRFEDMPRYRCVAIHSEIPFEEQESALQPAAPDEVKVIIATNAAESSVTLPDVDVVLCLGTHKAVNYRPGDLMRSTLTNTWVSKSSAVQRAGRTGRVRPGEVYRLYTRAVFEQFDDHQQAEIHCKPLHEIILTLKSIFHDNHERIHVTTILKELLESPDLSRVQDCFDLLYESNMIAAPADDAKLTSHGAFAGKMPVDLSLTKLIIYGISLGLGAEAVVLASALSQPKTVFRIATPLVHKDPDEYNEIVFVTFLGMLQFDNNAYSEPLMLLQLFIVWRSFGSSSSQEKKNFLEKFGIVGVRMRQFASSTQNLLKSVNECKGKACAELSFDKLQENLTSKTVNKLRLMLLWALEFNLLQADDPRPPANPLTVAFHDKDSFPKDAFFEYFPAPFDGVALQQNLCKLLYQMPSVLPSVQSTPAMLRHLYREARRSASDCTQAMVVYRWTVKHRMDAVPMHVRKNSDSHAMRASESIELRVFLGVSQAVLQGAQSPGVVNVLSAAAELSNHGLASELEPLSEFSDEAHDLVIFSFVVKSEKEIDSLSQVAMQNTNKGFVVSLREKKDTRFVAINFQPSQDLLRGLYPSRLLDNDYNLANVVNKAMRKPTKMGESVLLINFDEQEEIPAQSELLAEMLPRLDPLCTDIPPAMRLFNAYCIGQTPGKSMKVKIHKEPQQNSTRSITSFVPGSVAWKQSKEPRSDSRVAAEDKGTGEGEDRVISVAAKPFVSKWRVHGSFSAEDAPYEDGAHKTVMYEAGGWKSAFLSTRSLLATTRQLPDPSEPFCSLFGVAYQALAMISSTADKSTKISCQGVTLFPPDKTWILRGLLCIGRRLSPDSEDELDGLSNSHRVVNPRSSQCRAIRSQLTQLKRKSFKPDTQLIDAIDELFFDYE